MDEPVRRDDEALARHAIDVEAHDARDALAEIFAARLAGRARAAEEAGIDDDGLALAEAGDGAAEPLDGGRTFDADDKRQRALGESHAAQAEEVDVVQRHRAHAHQHVVRARRRRVVHLAEFELLFLDEAEGAHHAAAKTRLTFCPPKPNELESANSTFCVRAWLGTTSS